MALGFCMMATCAAALKLFLPPDGMAIRRGRNCSPGISEPMSTVTVSVSGSYVALSNRSAMRIVVARLLLMSYLMGMFTFGVSVSP